MVDRTDIDAVSQLVRDLHSPDLVSLSTPKPGEAAVLVVPKGMEAIDVKAHLDKFRDRPERREGRAQFETLGSFNEHVLRFKSEDSALFATRGQAKCPKLVSVLDYHRRGAAGEPQNCKHRGVYEFPISEEWRLWTAQDDEFMPLADFARFIEDRIADVIGPDRAGDGAKAWSAQTGENFATPAKLVELSRGLKVNINGRVQNVVNLSTGETQMTFAEEHTNETGAPLRVPGAFLIQIPVFRNGAVYQLPARLRYRASGGIHWGYSLYRVDANFDHAFNEACDRAVEATGLPLFYGSPEGG